MIKEHQACSKQNTQEIPLWGFVPKHISVPGEKGENKVSCKGLNKQHTTLTKDTYQQVLETQEIGGGTNIDFKTDGKTMFTDTQYRKSLVFFFFFFFFMKRVVGSDGISTFPTSV